MTEAILLKSIDELSRKVDKLEETLEKFQEKVGTNFEQLDEKVEGHGRIIATGTGALKTVLWVSTTAVTLWSIYSGMVSKSEAIRHSFEPPAAIYNKGN
jgi:hypothetical protein